MTLPSPSTAPRRCRRTVELVYATGFARICATPDGWETRFRAGLETLAFGAADYVYAVQEARAGRPCRDPDDLALLRIQVRQMMADFLLLPPHRVRMGEIRPDGLDADIARLCGVAPLQP